MNTIITLQYKLTAGTPEYNPYVLDFSTAAVFEQLRVNQHPVCLVVSGRDLASLKEQSYLINYLGEKKKAIQLTRYFNRPQKHTVPLLACNYSNEGRLAIGIKALLSHIEKNGGPGIVMLSVSPVIFDTLLRLAEGWMTDQIIPLGEDLAVDNLGCGNNEDDTHSLLSRLSEIREPHDLKDKYIGMAKAVQLVRKRIVNAAHCDLPVLIIGDNGTGKEIVARQIHEIGKDQKHPFCPINCGAISKEILEVELFGCEANVTGPQYPARTGLWQAAGEGTLFLDEIGDLSLDHQAKILRALQEKKIRRVGSNREVHAPARIIAATNKNLLSITLNGQFRYDLYSRLNQMRIETPALRDHLEDLGIIAQALWQKTCTNENAHLSDDILDYLKRYNWPGNVRELKSLLGCCYATFKRIQPELRKIKDAFILQGYDIHHLNRAVVQLEPAETYRAKSLQQLTRVYEIFQGILEQLENMDDSYNPYGPTAVEPSFLSRSVIVNELKAVVGKKSHYLLKKPIIQGIVEVVEILKPDVEKENFPEEYMDIKEKLQTINDEILRTIENIMSRKNE